MSEKIRQYQLRLFNKLFSTLPSVKKMNNDKVILDLDAPITHFYSFRNKKFWFCKGETDDAYLYLFGKDPHEKGIGESDATIIIDFDKNKQFSEDRLGLFSIHGAEIHVLINDDILNQRYPYFNTGKFKTSQFKSIDNNKNFNVIDLGGLNNDFIKNIEELVQLSPKINEKTPKNIAAEKNLSKNVEKDEKIVEEEKSSNEENSKIETDEDLCEICSQDKKSIKIDSKLNKISKIRPELCGNCIEKIVMSEFYNKINPLITSNETKSLKTTKEKFGNDQLFDLGIKLLEKYQILRYIGVKKQIFILDKNHYIVSKYIKYSDENNLLIDNLFKAKENKPKKKSTPKPDINHTNLTKQTKRKMNLFINALISGKTHKEAYRIARINEQKVENWYKFGKRGEFNYIPFYEKYKPLRPENQEKQRKIEIFLDTLKKEENIDNALEKSGLKISKVRAWYNMGEKGDEEYKDFYIACKNILPEGIPKKETKKIVNNDELMNEFIALIDDGKTNNEAIKQLKIPNFKVKNWVNQGKLGNKKYVNFYNAYMIEVETKKELKKAKKREKRLKKKQIEEEKIKQLAEELYGEPISLNEDRSCKICGRTLSKKTKKDICKRCLRKQYASKIVLKLLNSIEPEKPFKKEDLKVLGLQNIQVTDYLWTLQEFNLITKHNNKLQLVNKNDLETFIKESGLEIEDIPQGQTAVKLNKICKTCGESLEISKFFPSETTEDGFEDTCKDCKRLIAAAGYLNEIIQLVDYESEFSEKDLQTHFKNPFQLQAKIWALLDNDLLKKNFETNSYYLTDEKTVNEFLDKYYDEEKATPIENPFIEHWTEELPKVNSKENQMKTVIESIKEGKSRKEAAEIADIPLYKITHWYNEGRQGFGKDNINFYNQLKDIENSAEYENKQLKIRMNQVLDELKTNADISKITKSDEFEINEWLKKGELGEKPYDYFFEAYNNIIGNDKNKAEEYKNKAINRKIFLENFKAGKSKEICAEYGNLDLSLVHEWYLKGQNNEEPYREFYEKYTEIKNSKNTEIPRIVKTDKFGTVSAINQMNIILESLAKGMSEEEAISNANITSSTYQHWLNRGKHGFGEAYAQFYHYVNKLKNEKPPATPSNGIEEKLDELLVPLEEKYEVLFRSAKMNRTGIAWVNIIGKQWVYQKSHNNYPMKLSNSNIYNLYLEVKKNNLPWGVRDQKLAKSIILEYYELNTEPDTETSDEIPKEIEKNVDSRIYDPLPEKYEEAFKSSPTNKSGIAWVNNPGTGKRWIYEKRVNGETVRFVDEDIYELHKKVIGANHVWGIRDYSKASKIIDIPDDFEIPQKNISQDTSQEIPEFIDPDIYAPLSEELSSTFNPSQPNKTGIAWVNKSGSNWRYSRKLNGKPIEVVDENIYELHRKVKNLNYDWGIRDYQKARGIIKIPEDYHPPAKEPDAKDEPEDRELGIFTPLPEKYLNSFNPKQPNKTGIAWVNKVGLNWVYQRQIKGKTIKISDYYIRNLYEKVKDNQQVWGIIDYTKAERIINSEKIPTSRKGKSEETEQPITSTNVAVTYIEKPVNNFEIMIKGIIKNTELIALLNRLDLFEENIKRIVTTSIGNQVDIFIELEINRYSIKTFEDKIDGLNWKINK